MKILNILHVSDVHIQKKDEADIKEIVQKLLDDIKKVQIEKNISIDLICFTGDLIQRGDMALDGERQWEMGKEILINPLLEQLGISFDKFIFVPGNHEVNTSEIVLGHERGLHIKSLQEIDELMKGFDKSYIKRLAYFYNIVKKYHSDVTFGKIGYSYKKQINGLNVGIACVDSAWRSSGKGFVEKGKLYVGSSQIKELFNNIEECEIKICMMHHPIEWLEECENLEVEKELEKFDFVLRGHVHEADLKQVIRRNLRTVYSTAGKLYPLDYAEGRAVDGYNGYSILNIDYEKSKCNVYIRSYYGKNRKEFDVGINICPNGEEAYEISLSKNGEDLEFDLIKGINKYFCDMSEKYALIKEADSQSPKDYSQVIVEPVLGEKSEYVKENGADEETREVNIRDIVSSNENILLIGKKESGKTTILQQIGLSYINEYEKRKIIPIHIDMKYLTKGNNKILNSTIRFFQDNIIDNASISKQQIKEILDDGGVVFLIDNVNTNDSNHTAWLTKFISEYNRNRFILTLEEEFFQSLDVKEIPDYGKDFKQIYIQYMGRTQIRAMVNQWAKGREDIIDIDETVNRIDSYCNQINFAKTPFNIAVFMVIWDNDHNYIPVNEGIVMENYLEIILEKLSPKETYRKTYSFRIKQDFLSYVAYKMCLKDEYCFSSEEFEDVLNKYHEKKGYSLSKSGFDSIFFEKNILSYSGDYIVFSHTSFLEYYLALYAYNDKDFLDKITREGNRILFKNEILFYAGLNQNCTQLLDNLSEAILNTVVEYMDIVEDLNELEIVTDFKIDREKFIEDIQRNRPSQEELDVVNDKNCKYNEKNPKEIKKRNVEERDAEDFFSLLQMYGSVIKNAELLDNSYKIMHLENYMYGMNILYSMLIKLYEYLRDEIDFEKLTDEDKATLDIFTEEKFEKEKANMVDVSKLMYPIAIQNVILENVGTPKLESAINELMKRKKDKPFEKFMLAFLKCDLKIVNLKNVLNIYIKEEKSSSILKIMLIKLTFYYRMRFFGNDKKIDKELIDLITEIQMKLNPTRNQNFYKSQLTKETEFRLNQRLNNRK